MTPIDAPAPAVRTLSSRFWQAVRGSEMASYQKKKEGIGVLMPKNRMVAGVVKAPIAKKGGFYGQKQK